MDENCAEEGARIVTQFLSPLRYPGGKSWLRRDFERWAVSLGYRAEWLIEPFAGGASIGLHAVFYDIVEHLHIVELDPVVASFWEVVFSSECIELVERIQRFNLQEDDARRILLTTSDSKVGDAFRFLLRNRLNFGGIVARGAGPLRRGEGDRGLFSRWNPTELEERLRRLADLRHRVRVSNADGLNILRASAEDHAIAFVDPPYIGTARAAGKRLYDFHDVDPEDVFGACMAFGKPFLLTHEADQLISSLAQSHGLEYVERKRLSRSHHPQREYLISQSMKWM